MHLSRQFFLGLALLAPLGCGKTVVDFGPPFAATGDPGPGGQGAQGGQGAGGGASSTGGEGGAIDVPPLSSAFQWLNPKPQGNQFRAIDATGDSNLWIGGRGAVHAWNGNSWKEHVPALADVAYHALWVRAPGDVWAGGTELHWEEGVAVEAAVLFHYAGNEWTPAPLPTTGIIGALAGSGNEALLVQGKADIARLVDGAWVADATFDAKLRALWSAEADESWVVGEDGFIARRTSGGWMPMGAAFAGDGDPFGADRHYLGVWGSASDDVWAVFETAKLDGGIFALEDGQVGFSHWNGSSWSVELTRPMHCPSDSEFAEVYTGVHWATGAEMLHAFDDRDEYAARRGALMAGRSGSDILASIGGGRCLWHYDGTTWNDIVQQHVPANGEGSTLLVGSFPLGDAPPVGATSSMLLIGGAAGQLVSFDPEQALPAEAYTDLSPQLSHLLEAERPALRELALRDGESHALADGRPATWTAGGWVPLEGPPGSLDPSQLFDPGDLESVRGLQRLHIDHSGSIWVFGGNHDAYAARYDGTQWMEVEVQPTEDWSYDSGPRSVWSSPAGELWMTSAWDMRRYDGGSFELFNPPVASPYTGGVYEAVTGLDDGQVLTARTIEKGLASYETVVYRIEGDQVTEALTVPGTHGFEMYALPPDRALMIRWDGQAYHFDGTGVQPLDWAEPPIANVWYAPGDHRVVARGLDDLFVLAHDVHGSHVLHFDGKTWTQLFSADRLSSIASDGDTLWVVGPNGATARAQLSPRTD